MASGPGAPERNPFDIRLVRQLVGLMRENDLSEIALQWETSRVRLRRGPMGGVTYAATPPLAFNGAAPQAAAPPPAAAAAEPAAVGVLIKSPTVGTFFAASAPEAQPYVKVGSVVTPDSIVCMVEAMKVYNEIPAGVAGTILEVLVENQSPVEFGQPLFRVKPN